MVIFSIIVIIQFVVITKGATRISEVAARFSLDALPGRQMSIDAQLNAGTIDESTAAQMREALTDAVDFYGSMDGASKFVRGDAIAGILITLVNIVGGLVVGMTSGMSIGEASRVFTKLTIGDGLVSQLPALLISVAAAMLVSRRSRRTNLPRETVVQLVAQPSVLLITAAFLGLIAFTELPKLPLLLLGGGLAWLGWWTAGHQRSERIAQQQAEQSQPKPQPEIPLSRLLGNEVMMMELGADLLRLVTPDQGPGLLESVGQLRQRYAKETGVVLPKFRICDNLRIPRQQYRVMIHGNPVEIGTLYPSCL